MIEVTSTLSELAGRINAEHEQCALAARTSLEHAMKAGALLLEAKTMVAHGEWLPWLDANCTLPESTARLYMQLARELPARLEQDKSLTVSDLGIREARALLAEPRAPQPQEPTLWDRVTDGASVPGTEAVTSDTEGDADAAKEDMAAYWEDNEPDGTGGRWPGPPPRPMTPAIADERNAEADLAERWKKDDDVHRMLWHVSRITALDPREAARLLGGIASLNSFARNDLTAAEMGIDWLRDYARALREALGLPATGLRSVQ